MIEGDYGQQRFLPEHPIHIANTGNFTKVPFITGVTSDEFANLAFSKFTPNSIKKICFLLMKTGIIGNESLREALDENFETYAPISFQYERDTNNSLAISRALRKFYFGTKPIDNSSLTQLGELYADALIGFGVDRAVKLIAEKSDKQVFYYKFSYQGRYSHFYLPGTNDSVPYGKQQIFIHEKLT